MSGAPPFVYTDADDRSPTLPVSTVPTASGSNTDIAGLESKQEPANDFSKWPVSNMEQIGNFLTGRYQEHPSIDRPGEMRACHDPAVERYKAAARDSFSTHHNTLTIPQPNINMDDTTLSIKGTGSNGYANEAMRAIQEVYSTQGEVVGSQHGLFLNPAMDKNTLVLLTCGTDAGRCLTVREMTPPAVSQFSRR